MTYDYQCARRSASADPDGGARAGTDKSYDDNVLGLWDRAVVPPKRSQKTENADNENTYGLRFCIECFPNNAKRSVPNPMVGSGSPHRVNTRIADGLV
jgi:hypothetical protein